MGKLIPSSVISDPTPDPQHPPRSAQMLIPSHGMGMNALFYLAGSAGTHPTMVLLRGFPGNEQKCVESGRFVSIGRDEKILKR